MKLKKNCLVLCLLTFVAISPNFFIAHAETVIDTIDIGWPSGVDPGPVVVNEDTNCIYVANSNHTVSVIDGSSNNLLATIPVMQGSEIVNPDDSDSSVDLSSEKERLVISYVEFDAISIVDTVNNEEIAQISVGSRPEYVEHFDNNNRIYVCNSGSGTVTVINGLSLAVESTIVVGTNPAAIGIFGWRLYVSNEGSNSVSVIEGNPSSPEFNTVIETIPLPGASGPIGIEDNEITHKLYVANSGSNNVSVIDADTNSFVKNISLPGAATTAWLLVNDATNYVYVLNEGSNNISVIDGSTDSVVATIPVGDVTDWPESMTINQTTHRIYVSNTDDDNISVIEGDPLSPYFNSVIATIPVGWVPYAIVVNEVTNRIYVGVEDMDGLSVIDGVANSLITIIELGGGPKGLAVDKVNNRIYVGHSNTNNMRIEGATNNVTYFPAGPFNFELAVNGQTNWSYYTNDWTNTVRAVNGATLEVTLIPVDAGYALEDIIVNPLTNRIYASSGSKKIFVIDGDPLSAQFNTVIATINTLYPDSMAINENTNLIYVTNGDDGDGRSLTIIDGSTNQVTGVMMVGLDPGAVVVNKDTNRIFVGNNDDSISVIDGFTNTIIATIPVLEGPWELEINETTNRIYVGYGEENPANNIITVINGATNSVESNINLPQAIMEEAPAIAINESQGRVYVLDEENNSVYVVDGNPSSPKFNEVLQNILVGMCPVDIVVNEQTGHVYVAHKYSNSITVLKVDNPVPDIKAKGSDGPVDLALGETLSVTIALDPGIYPGVQADWWVLANTPFGFYYKNLSFGWQPGLSVTHQGPLFNLTPPLEVLNTSGLPTGNYTFYFGVDGNMNGILDQPLFYDSVMVDVN
jgi:YVTN family beta-propeller protein